MGIATLASTGQSQNLNFAVPVEALLSLKAKAGSAPFSERTAKSDLDIKLRSDPDYEALEASKAANDWVGSFKIAGRLVKKFPNSAAAYFLHAFCAAKLNGCDRSLM